MADLGRTALLAAAVADNVRLVDAVVRAHGVSTRTAPGLWVAGEATPPGYPEAVTTAPAVRSADVVPALPPRRPGGPPRSVKDSYADLDLSGHGFQVLFEASWLGQPAGTGAGAEAGAGAGAGAGAVPGAWWLVDESSLDAWRRAREAAGAPEAPALLAGAPGVTLLGRGPRAAPDAWAVATTGGGLPVVGVSNVGTDGAGAGAADGGGSGGPGAGPGGAGTGGARVWTGLLGVLADLAPGLPVVGYESGDDLALALAAGLQELGPLRVWLEEP